MPGQVQSPGEGVLHRPAPGHAEEQLRHAPQHSHPQQGCQQPAAKVLGQQTGDRQGEDKKAQRKCQQAFWQPHPRAFGQAGRWIEATFEHKERADKHQRRGHQQGVAEDAVMQPQAMHQNRQQRRQYKTPGSGNVGIGHVLVTGDHVVQINHITPRHGQQASEQIDPGRAATTPHMHPPHGADDGQPQSCE